MEISNAILIQQFLRRYKKPFYLQDFFSLLIAAGIKTTINKCRKFLYFNEKVFTLSNDLFITRAGAFTNRFFSFRPLRKEIEKGIFILGHRCMPFVDPEFLSCGFILKYKNTELPKRIVEFNTATAFELFCLYGEEFAVQYIAADPANRKIDLSARDFSLPSNICITGFSLEPLIKKDGFKSGDRILCKVKDWDQGIIDISVIHRNEEPLQINDYDLKIETWYKKLEAYLLESFEQEGPCASIEEQLAVVFANNKTLCTKNCGSIEELFKRSKKIGFEQFGVETRLWKKGENIPILELWPSNISFFTKTLNINEIFTEKGSNFIIDALIKNQIYLKSCNLTKIIEELYPTFYCSAGQTQKTILLRLKNRYDKIAKEYNRFADYSIGYLRAKILKLYSSVNKLVTLINESNTELSEYPQQPLVILSQILGHTIRLIELMENDTVSLLRDLSEIEFSIEGMEFNFEFISSELKEILNKGNKNCFMIIK